MHCPVCSQWNDNKMAFCTQCGTPINKEDTQRQTAGPQGSYNPVFSPSSGMSLPRGGLADNASAGTANYSFEPVEPSMEGVSIPYFPSSDHINRGNAPGTYSAPGMPDRIEANRLPDFLQEKIGDPQVNWMAAAGMTCGIASIPCIMSPVAAFLIGLTGFILSIKGLKSQHRGAAIAGIVCSSLGLLGALICFVYIFLDLERINVFQL